MSALRNKLVAAFKAKEFDQGLIDGANLALQKMDAHATTASTGTGMVPPVLPGNRMPAAPGANGNWGIGGLACVVIAIVFGIIALRGIFGHCAADTIPSKAATTRRSRAVIRSKAAITRRTMEVGAVAADSAAGSWVDCSAAPSVDTPPTDSCTRANPDMSRPLPVVTPALVEASVTPHPVQTSAGAAMSAPAVTSVAAAVVETSAAGAAVTPVAAAGEISKNAQF